MNKQITLYFKPVNKYNLKGSYYTIYINKIPNLNLSSLPQTPPTNTTNTSTSTIKQPNIILPESTHSKLIMLLQNQAIILTKIQKSLNEFSNTNNEIQNLLHTPQENKILMKGLNI